MLIATDFLSVGFSSPKTFILHSMPPPPVILREAEGEVVESIIEKITHTLRERGAVADDGRGPGKSTFLYPSSALVENFTQGEGFFTLREAVDSATPGKPFVQNDIRES